MILVEFTLSDVSQFVGKEIGAVPTDAGAAFNYGLDKVRFLAPVKAGARVRLRVVLIDVERKSGGVVLKTNNIFGDRGFGQAGASRRIAGADHAL